MAVLMQELARSEHFILRQLLKHLGVHVDPIADFSSPTYDHVNAVRVLWPARSVLFELLEFTIKLLQVVLAVVAVGLDVFDLVLVVFDYHGSLLLELLVDLRHLFALSERTFSARGSLVHRGLVLVKF